MSGTLSACYTVGVPVGSTGAAAARFEAAAFGADFLAVAFLAAGFFFADAGVAFASEAFFVDATAFFTAGFAIFFATLTAFAALAAGFLAVTGAFASDFATALCPTRNASRLFAPAIQFGARPTPDQVFPVFGSAYFATDAVFAFAFVFVFFAASLPATECGDESRVVLLRDRALLRQSTIRQTTPPPERS